MNNIIYILLDQVRKDMLGTYGHQVVKTQIWIAWRKTAFGLTTPLRRLRSAGRLAPRCLPA